MGGSGGRRKKYVKERQGEKGNGIEGRKEVEETEREEGRERSSFQNHYLLYFLPGSFAFYI